MLHDDRREHEPSAPQIDRPNRPLDLGLDGLGRWKLLTPFLFLRIQYAERRAYNLMAVAIAALVTAIYWFAPSKPPLMGEQGLLKDLKDFVTVLFPFFVGALAALATFTRVGLDQPTIGGRVRLVIKDRVKDLTRRQFVCFIFGYCAALSVVLFIAIVLVKMIQPTAVGMLPTSLPYLRAVTVAAFALAFSHLIVVTFWGLYYLSERLYRA